MMKKKQTTFSDYVINTEQENKKKEQRELRAKLRNSLLGGKYVYNITIENSKVN